MPKGFEIDGLGEDVSLGKGGPRFVRNGQIVEHRDSTGALTRTKGANGVAADDYATVAQLGGGGSSFGVFNPLVAPSSPNPLDVETWTDLPSGWASWTPGAVGPALPQTRSIDRGALILDIGSLAAGIGSAMNGVYRAIPVDSEWAAYTRLSLLGVRTASGVFFSVGFALALDLAGAANTSWIDGGDAFQQDANSVTTFYRGASFANFAANPSNKAGAPGNILLPMSAWFRLRKTNPSDTTSYAADFSMDGIRWQSLHTGASFSVPATPSHLVIYARSLASPTTTAPGFRIVVGPTRFATGSTANNLTSLIPAGT